MAGRAKAAGSGQPRRARSADTSSISERTSPASWTESASPTRVYPASKIRRDALVFPVAVARRLRTLGALIFLFPRRGVGRGLPAALFGFGQRPLCRRGQRLASGFWRCGSVGHFSCFLPAAVAVNPVTRRPHHNHEIQLPILTFGIFAWHSFISSRWHEPK